MFKFPYLDSLTNSDFELVEARLTEVEDSGHLGIWVFEITTQLN